MAFRYIRAPEDIRRFDGGGKPRLLLLEPQRLFADNLTSLLEPTFEVIPFEENNPDRGHDIIVIDADAASLECVEDIVELNSRGAPICLLATAAAPRVHSGGQVHVLSKNMGKGEFLAAVKRITRRPESSFPFLHPVPLLPDLGFSSTYVFVLPGCGGDWYDVFETHGRIAFAIGDVAGHGAEAAHSMNLVRHAMVRLALENADPAVMLATANALIISTNALYTTALCGYIDPVSREIVYAGAGHPPPILASGAQSATFLQYDGVILGAQDDAAYKTVRLQAPADGLFVLYTDGVTERDGDVIDGERRLLDAVRQAVVDGVTDAARAIQDAMFVEKAPVDDVAILAISFGKNRSAAHLQAVH